MQAAAEGRISSAALDDLFDDAVRDTLRRFEATGSPVDHRRRAAQAELRDVPGRRAHEPRAGRRHDPVRGRPHPAAAAAHERPVPLRHAGVVLPRRRARRARPRPLKQAVISASALSLLYPGDGLEGYSRDTFVEDLVDQAADELRGMRRPRRHRRRSTSPRRACRSSSIPSGGLLDAFVDLNNQVLARLTDEERAQGRRPHLPRRRPRLDAQRRHRLRGAAARRCSGSTSTGSSSSSPARPTGERVLGILGEQATGDRRIFVGVIDPLDPRVETPEEVARPRARGGPVHRSRPPRHDRRLRLLAVRRRRVDVARHGVREDRGTGRGDADRLGATRGLAPGDQAAAAPLMRPRPPYAPLDHATTSRASPATSHR